jgi:hypothetical protein
VNAVLDRVCRFALPLHGDGMHVVAERREAARHLEEVRGSLIGIG